MTTRLQPSESDIMSMSDLRRVNVSTDPSLWVLNTSDRQGTRPQGDILIEVDLPGGRNTVITIPKTWIPIDLSTFARRDLILDSSQFAQAVRNMSITPVSSEWAEGIEKRSDVRDERNYLALRATGSLSSTTNAKAGAANSGAAPGTEVPDIMDGVSPRVITVMETDDSEMSPAVKLLSLKNLQPEIRGPELRYILSKCGPEHDAISKWVNDATRAIQSAGGYV